MPAAFIKPRQYFESMLLFEKYATIVLFFPGSGKVVCTQKVFRFAARGNYNLSTEKGFCERF